MDTGSDWEPPPPDTSRYDGRIGGQLNSNFKSLVHQNYKGADAKALLLAYNYPEYRSQLSPQLQKDLNNLMQQAYEQTQSEMGFPEGWQPPADPEYTNVVLSHYDRTYDEGAMNEKDLTPKERKELKTLHRFPKAKVSDREKLQHHHKTLDAKAQASTRQRFGLPDNFKLRPQAGLYKLGLTGGFKHQFEKEILARMRKGEISPDEARRLLATKGVDPSKIPANLQTVYTQARQSAAKKTASDYGLPDSWEPSESSDASEETGGNEGTVRNADGSIRVRANTRVQLKSDTTQESQPIDPVSTPAPDRDHRTTHKFLNYYDTNIGVTRSILPRYWTGPRVMGAGDALFAVGIALDNLRTSVYMLQEAEATAARAIMQGEADAQEEVYKDELAKMNQPPPKEFILFKIFSAIPVFGKIWETFFKLSMWALNVLTGGAVNMITQALNMQPIEENPLQMVGMINAQQAATMDMALGFIVMAVEMAVSILGCQPELILAEIGEMMTELAATSAEVGEDVASDAVRAAAKIGGEAAVDGASDAVDAVSNVVSRSAAEFEDVVQDVASTGVKSASKAALRTAAKEAAKEAAQDTTADATKAAQKSVSKIVQNALKRMVEGQVKSMQRTWSQRITDLKSFIKDPIGFTRTAISTRLTAIGTSIANGFSTVSGWFSKGGDVAGDAARGSKGMKAIDAADAEGGDGGGAPEGSENEDAQDAQKDAQNDAQSKATPNSSSSSSGNASSDSTSSASDTSKGAGTGKGKGVKSSKGGAEGEDSDSDSDSTSSSDAKGAGDPEVSVKSDDTNSQGTPETKSSQGGTPSKLKEKNLQAKKPQDADAGVEDDPDAELKENASKKAKMKEEMKSSKKEKVNAKMKEKLRNDAKAKAKLKEAYMKKVTKDVLEKHFKIEIKDGSDLDKQINKAIKAKVKDTADQANVGKSLKQDGQTVKTDTNAGGKDTSGGKAGKSDGNADKSDGKPGKSEGKDGKVGAGAGSVAADADDGEIKSLNKAISDLEDDVHAEMKALRKEEKLAAQNQYNRYNFMMDVQTYMRDAVQTAGYTAQAIMYFRKSAAELKAAELQAFIELMQAYEGMDEQAVNSLMQGMQSLAGWINDINQQESSFWKKMQIRYIAA